MRILQVLPALHSGGVERGTVEFAAELVRRGHESIVLSSGGPLAKQLEEQGSTHITRPVHRKSLRSFGQIRPVRALLREFRPDIVHVRSRMPAWIIYLAWRGLPPKERPALVATFHGMYSVNPYSAVMARAQQLIAVSNCVRDYVVDNYRVDPQRLTVIQRGVDVDGFRRATLDPGWLEQLHSQQPQLRGKRLLLMPGRISRWKGQLQFLEVMARIVGQRPECHGLIVGGAEPGKERFLQELEQRRRELGLNEAVSFLGQRSDMAELYLAADLVCHMSTKPEPFGRTVTEALASGTPVVAFDRGGAAETLRACFPEGLVNPDDTEAFAHCAMALLDQTEYRIRLPRRFRLDAQVEATLAVYQRALAERASGTR
ncbi:MAG: glycosyltransferase family 4 protein [Marinobacter sp.]|uniref:glycosyltransferase family 4 protein n=1 Tax=Marinobacter sp. TaxID=50741 RepID=UPI00299F202D|nr:glycosyltransferase family 4 protein [Marinobacter sp.]MDX1634980.1 glycosyltransferase family 4 protein [Marinobacter sp.]